MKLTVFSPDGTKSSEQDFAGLPTFDGDRGLQAVKEVIVAINANNRQGTHSTKTRGEVRGGGKKPWRQKGTGRARAGSIRSPLWGGGGVVFGPKPRDYSKKINGKVKSLAFSRALFDRASAGELAVIEQFEFAQPKTKLANQVVERVAPQGKVLLVDAPFAPATQRAIRNLHRVSLPEAAKLTPHDPAHRPRRSARSAISNAFPFRKPRSSTPTISRTTRKSSSAPRRSRRSSPASPEGKTDASRPSAQTRPPHRKGQQAQLRARPIHVRGVQIREQARHRRGRRADLQGHRPPRQRDAHPRQKQKEPPGPAEHRLGLQEGHRRSEERP